MTTVSYESELERTGRITITIKGVSMRPLFHAGSDVILVKKCPVDAIKNLEIVLFKRPGPDGVEYVLHRIVGRQPDGDYIIAGDNCIGTDIVPPQDILGSVVSAQRGSKPIPLKGIRYTIYIGVWCAPYRLRSMVLRARNKARAAARRIASRRREQNGI